jgi:preprotein translocase subunit Sec63
VCVYVCVCVCVCVCVNVSTYVFFLGRCVLQANSADVRSNIKQAKLDLKKSKRKDYYKILGVEKDADEREIKKAYV